METPLKGALDDAGYPAYAMSTAAQMVGVTPAFLRTIGTHGLLSPGRSGGGHRRYSRNELDVAFRVKEVVDEGISLAAACRIVDLEHQLDYAHAQIVALQHQLDALTPKKR